MDQSDAQRTSAETQVAAMATRARQAGRALARSPLAVRNAVLTHLAAALAARGDELKAANALDLTRARDLGLADAMLDRLRLSDAALAAMQDGLLQLARADDPIGAIFDLKRQPSGIEVGRMRVPLGVIGIIYEARPNVTVDAAALCIKSGNATLLRGGSEALHSNLILGRLLNEALAASGLPEAAVQVVPSTERAFVDAMARAAGHIDVLIPRGGRGLIERLMAVARVPMIKHLEGICAVYVDRHADLAQALAISENAKTQRYGTCNTMETLLVHREVAGAFLPQMAQRFAEKGVEMRGDSAARRLVASMKEAGEEDFRTEFLAPVVAVGVVDSLDAAIDHINTYGSHHTDAIVSQDSESQKRFLREVDSASVMVNASTRFADGFEFGLGAEIGISNDKLHARGPVGLEGLTSVKYVVLGDGHIRR